MMQIELQQLKKRFNKEIIFQGLDYSFESGVSYALTGPNGSGKSTLMQIISGYLLPSGGKVVYNHEKETIKEEEIYKHITIATPYLELVEELTLYELMNFHFTFKDTKKGDSIDKILERCYLTGSQSKLIKHFSSGMKQRLKLALAFFTESKVILLDEPTTNLDENGVSWYQEQLRALIEPGDSIIIIASNQKHEYEHCNKVLNIVDYK